MMPLPVRVPDISAIDPRVYGATRNYLDGAVTRLGPWITHGAVTLKDVATGMINRHGPEVSLPFLFQLTWREHFYRLWLRHGDGIFSDLCRPQPSSERAGVPAAIASASTGVTTIDSAIAQLFATGSMHNHARLWVASICSNVARCSWQDGARWMYYHLLDGDLASNFLSWQWVAGTSRQERYLANQENVNKFSKFHQEGTLIDRSYEELAEAKIPTELVEVASSELLPWVPPNEFSPLPSNEAGDSRVLLYLPWTLDPEWRKEERGARVVWFDAELFVRFPVSPLRGTFVNSLKLALPGQTRWFVGTKAELFATLSGRTVLARAHPLLPEWVPGPDSSEMLFKNVPHNGGSFMSFWKRCEAQLRSTGGV